MEKQKPPTTSSVGIAIVNKPGKSSIGSAWQRQIDSAGGKGNEGATSGVPKRPWERQTSAGTIKYKFETRPASSDIPPRPIALRINNRVGGPKFTINNPQKVNVANTKIPSPKSIKRSQSAKAPTTAQKSPPSSKKSPPGARKSPPGSRIPKRKSPPGSPKSKPNKFSMLMKGDKSSFKSAVKDMSTLKMRIARVTDFVRGHNKISQQQKDLLVAAIESESYTCRDMNLVIYAGPDLQARFVLPGKDPSNSKVLHHSTKQFIKQSIAKLKFPEDIKKGLTKSIEDDQVKIGLSNVTIIIKSGKTTQNITLNLPAVLYPQIIQRETNIQTTKLIEVVDKFTTDSNMSAEEQNAILSSIYNNNYYLDDKKLSILMKDGTRKSSIDIQIDPNDLQTDSSPSFNFPYFYIPQDVSDDEIVNIMIKCIADSTIDPKNRDIAIQAIKNGRFKREKNKIIIEEGVPSPLSSPEFAIKIMNADKTRRRKHFEASISNTSLPVTTDEEEEDNTAIIDSISLVTLKHKVIKVISLLQLTDAQKIELINKMLDDDYTLKAGILTVNCEPGLKVKFVTEDGDVKEVIINEGKPIPVRVLLLGTKAIGESKFNQEKKELLIEKFYSGDYSEDRGQIRIDVMFKSIPIKIGFSVPRKDPNDHSSDVPEDEIQSRVVDNIPHSALDNNEKCDVIKMLINDDYKVNQDEIVFKLKIPPRRVFKIPLIPGKDKQNRPKTKLTPDLRDKIMKVIKSSNFDEETQKLFIDQIDCLDEVGGDKFVLETVKKDGTPVKLTINVNYIINNICSPLSPQSLDKAVLVSDADLLAPEKKEPSIESETSLAVERPPAIKEDTVPDVEIPPSVSEDSTPAVETPPSLIEESVAVVETAAKTPENQSQVCHLDDVHVSADKDLSSVDDKIKGHLIKSLDASGMDEETVGILKDEINKLKEIKGDAIQLHGKKKDGTPIELTINISNITNVVNKEASPGSVKAVVDDHPEDASLKLEEESLSSDNDVPNVELDDKEAVKSRPKDYQRLASQEAQLPDVIVKPDDNNDGKLDIPATNDIKDQIKASLKNSNLDQETYDKLEKEIDNLQNLEGDQIKLNTTKDDGTPIELTINISHITRNMKSKKLNEEEGYEIIEAADVPKSENQPNNMTAKPGPDDDSHKKSLPITDEIKEQIKASLKNSNLDQETYDKLEKEVESLESFEGDQIKLNTTKDDGTPIELTINVSHITRKIKPKKLDEDEGYEIIEAAEVLKQKHEPVETAPSKLTLVEEDLDSSDSFEHVDANEIPVVDIDDKEQVKTTPKIKANR